MSQQLQSPAYQKIPDEEDYIRAFGIAPPPDPKHLSLREWQITLIEMKDEAGVTAQDIGDSAGVTKEIVNTTLYSAKAPYRSDVKHAISRLYNLSKQPQEIAIREFLSGPLDLVVEYWCKALGLFSEDAVIARNGMVSMPVCKKLGPALDIDPLTLSRWVRGVQKPHYSKLRSKHEYVLAVLKKRSKTNAPAK